VVEDNSVSNNRLAQSLEGKRGKELFIVAWKNSDMFLGIWKVT
jgi:hypothetical protein